MDGVSIETEANCEGCGMASEHCDCHTHPPRHPPTPTPTLVAEVQDRVWGDEPEPCESLTASARSEVAVFRHGQAVWSGRDGMYTLVSERRSPEHPITEAGAHSGEEEEVMAELIASSSSPPPIPDEQVWDIAAARAHLMSALGFRKTIASSTSIQEAQEVMAAALQDPELCADLTASAQEPLAVAEAQEVMAELIASGADTKQNWYELPIVLPLEYSTWCENHKDELGGTVASVSAPHITLLYGFDPKFYDEVAADVASFNITPADYTFGEVCKGDVSPVWLVEVISPKLQACFRLLHSKYENQHTLIDGLFKPHVTLCWLDVEIDEPDNTPMTIEEAREHLTSSLEDEGLLSAFLNETDEDFVRDVALWDRTQRMEEMEECPQPTSPLTPPPTLGGTDHYSHIRETADASYQPTADELTLPHCTFCKSTGEPYAVYRGHTMCGSTGEVECLKLLNSSPLFDPTIPPEPDC